MLGTFVVIAAYGPAKEPLQEAISAALKEFEQVDALMSVHRNDSELAQLNAHAAEGPVKVSSELFEVLAHARAISEATEGAFDVTIRPVVDLWGFLSRSPRVPVQEQLAEALSRAGFHHVELDAAACTVRFTRAGVSIDLGGIGKGYAVDRAIARLRALGVTRALVRAGGDLRVIGTPPGQPGWTIQIEDPSREGQRARVVLRDAALSTSGSYENYFVHAGRRYGHILDPRTGWPVENGIACTVIAPSCLESDAWATALFVLGPEIAAARFSQTKTFRMIHLDSAGALREVRSRGFPPVRQGKSSGGSADN